MANDGIEYLQLARNLAHHGSFSMGENGLPPSAHRPPLFPAMIASLWRGESEPITAILITNCVLGALTVCFTYLVARDRFGRRTSLLAAGLLAAAPMTCIFTVTVLTEALFTFLVVVAIFLWGRRGFAAAGFGFGLSALARPSILPFLAGLPALAILPTFRRQWRGLVIMLVVGLAVILPWTVRNAVIFNRLIPIAASGWGTNLLCGTLETDTGGRVWDGEKWGPLNLNTNPITRVDGISDETEIDRIRMRRALDRIVASPGSWLVARAGQYPKLFIYNGDFLLGQSNLSIREAFSAGRWEIVIFKLVFIGGNLLILVFGLIGMWGLRSKFAEHAHIILFPTFGMLIHLPVWIEPRYFLPMMPALLVLAAVGMRRAPLIGPVFSAIAYER